MNIDITARRRTGASPVVLAPTSPSRAGHPCALTATPSGSVMFADGSAVLANQGEGIQPREGGPT